MEWRTTSMLQDIQYAKDAKKHKQLCFTHGVNTLLHTIVLAKLFDGKQLNVCYIQGSHCASQTSQRIAQLVAWQSYTGT